MNQEHARRYRRCTTGLKLATAIGAAGLAAGVVLAGGTGTVPSAAQPLAPGTASARPAPADVYLHQPRAAGPRAIVITDTTGDGHGPDAVVVAGGDPGNGNGPKSVIIGDPGGDGPGPKIRASA
jgi:hypothetical protein